MSPSEAVAMRQTLKILLHNTEASDEVRYTSIQPELNRGKLISLCI